MARCRNLFLKRTSLAAGALTGSLTLYRSPAFRLIAALLCLAPLASHAAAPEAPAAEWARCAAYADASPAEQADLRALQAARAPALLWADGERRRLLAAQLAGLVDDGLAPADYPLPAETTAGWDACRDLAVSRSYLLALRHLAFGRLDQARVEPFWRDQAETRRQHDDWLALAIAGLPAPEQAFDRARPALASYQALRRAYAAQRGAQLPDRWPALPAGPLLRPGMTDARLPALARRLADTGFLAASEAARPHPVHDLALVAALEAFQRRHGLKVDGVLGPATLAALNISPAARRDQLRANLERLRWLARDWEADMLLVDIAAAQLHLFRDGRPAWTTRTQVGRPARPTPQLKSRITHLTLNPTWTVPPTIFREDKLPQILHDPAFLERHQFQVIDASGQPVPAHAVDWADPRGLRLRPGGRPGQPARAGRHPLRQPLRRVPARHPEPPPVRRQRAHLQLRLRAGRGRAGAGGTAADTGRTHRRRRAARHRQDPAVQPGAAATDRHGLLDGRCRRPGRDPLPPRRVPARPAARPRPAPLTPPGGGAAFELAPLRTGRTLATAQQEP